MSPSNYSTDLLPDYTNAGLAAAAEEKAGTVDTFLENLRHRAADRWSPPAERGQARSSEPIGVLPLPGFTKDFLKLHIGYCKSPGAPLQSRLEVVRTFLRNGVEQIFKETVCCSEWQQGAFGVFQGIADFAQYLGQPKQEHSALELVNCLHRAFEEHHGGWQRVCGQLITSALGATMPSEEDVADLPRIYTPPAHPPGMGCVRIGLQFFIRRANEHGDKAIFAQVQLVASKGRQLEPGVVILASPALRWTPTAAGKLLNWLLALFLDAEEQQDPTPEERPAPTEQPPAPAAKEEAQLTTRQKLPSSDQEWDQLRQLKHALGEGGYAPNDSEDLLRWFQTTVDRAVRVACACPGFLTMERVAVMTEHPQAGSQFVLNVHASRAHQEPRVSLMICAAASEGPARTTVSTREFRMDKAAYEIVSWLGSLFRLL